MGACVAVSQRSLTYLKENMAEIWDEPPVPTITPNEPPADSVGGTSLYEQLVAKAADRVQESLRQAALNPRPAPTEPPQRLVLPRSDPADIVDTIDPDLLAHAMALGLWTRFEWALGEIGELKETVAGLEEGIRLRDAEIVRLKRLNPNPTVNQMARQLFP